MPSLTQEQIRALMEAVEQKNEIVIDAILGTQLELPTKDPVLKQKRCFILACKYGFDEAVVLYLFKRRFDKNTLYAGLVAAIFSNSDDVVKTLIEDCGLDPNYIFSIADDVQTYDPDDPERENVEPMSILTHAVLEESRLDVLRYLLSLNQTQVNQKFTTSTVVNLTALAVAVGGGNTKAVRMLLEHGADPYIVQTTIAARKGRSPEEAEQDELGIGQSYSAYNMAERRVIKPKHVGVVKVLREWKARQDQLGNTRAVSIAVTAAAPSSAHSSGSDSPPRTKDSDSDSPGSAGSTPPKKDSPEGSPPQHKPLILASSSTPQFPNHMTKEQVLALGQEELEKLFFNHVTSSYKRERTTLEMFKNLYFCGVKLTYYDTDEKYDSFDGANAFHRAVSSISMYSLAEAMLEWGVDINIRDRNGRTALHRLANINFRESSDDEIIERMATHSMKNFIFKPRPSLRNKADVNAQDNEGNTPLHLAAGKGKIQVVKELLRHGADPLAENKLGFAPLRYAKLVCGNAEKLRAVTEVLEPLTIKPAAVVVRGFPKEPTASSDMRTESDRLFAELKKRNDRLRTTAVVASDANLSPAAQRPAPPPVPVVQVSKPAAVSQTSNSALTGHTWQRFPVPETRVAATAAASPSPETQVSAAPTPFIYLPPVQSQTEDDYAKARKKSRNPLSRFVGAITGGDSRKKEHQKPKVGSY